MGKTRKSLCVFIIIELLILPNIKLLIKYYQNHVTTDSVKYDSISCFIYSVIKPHIRE